MPVARRSWRVAVAGAAIALAAAPAAAQCAFPANPPPPAETLDGEVQRLRGLLDSCRPEQGAAGHPGQQRLFTWGHRTKLEWLLREPVLESCTYNRTRERTRELYRLARLLGPRYLALRPAVEALLQPPPHNLQEIRGRTPPPDLAAGDQVAQARHLAMVVFAYPELGEFVGRDLEARRAELDARLRADDKRRLIVEESERRAVAIGELERRLRTEHGLSAAERENIERRIDGHQQVREHNLETLEETAALDPVDEARILGELVTLDTLLDGDGDAGMQFQGASSYGYGVYLATDPLAWIQHFYTTRHAGLVCDFSGGGAPQLVVADLTHPADLAALTRYPGPGVEAPALGVLVPADAQNMKLDGYNRYVHPEAFDLASHARLLMVRTGQDSVVYVDRCAIDYRGGSCRWFRVDDLTCEQAATLDQDAASLHRMHDFLADTDPDRDALDGLNQRCRTHLAWY